MLTLMADWGTQPRVYSLILLDLKPKYTDILRVDVYNLIVLALVAEDTDTHQLRADRAYSSGLLAITADYTDNVFPKTIICQRSGYL